MPMLKKVMQVIEKWNLLNHHQKLVIGVSGGSDSIALLHLFLQLKHELQLELHAAHVNYLLRGAESEADQAFVESICQRWQVPLSVKRIHLAVELNEGGHNLQALARKYRYQFFKEVLEQTHATVLTTAHHGNDQAETLLLNLVRGSGLSGLKGMPFKKQFGHFVHIRPLLSFTKEEIEAYCHEQELEPRVDSSNLKDDYARNYVRKHIVPRLKKINPQFIQQIEETAETFQVEDTYLNRLAEEQLQQCSIQDGNIVNLDVNRFQSIPLALQRRVILLILNCLRKEEQLNAFSKIHIEQIIQLLQSTAGSKSIHLPQGIRVVRVYNNASFNPTTQDQQLQTTYKQVLEGGDVSWEQAGCFFFVRLRKLTYSEYLQYVGQQTEDEHSFLNTYIGLDAQEIKMPLVVRNRRAGDRLEPVGLDGTQKLKAIFINAKIPKQERDLWPILCDQEDILWIPGLKQGKKGKVSSNTTEVLLIEVKLNREGQHSC